MKLSALLIATAFVSAFSIPVSSAEIGQLLSEQSGDLEITLREPATATNVFIEGRTVRIVGTDELGTLISTTSEGPMFIVGADATLILEDVALDAFGPAPTEGATTAILVEGGHLQLNYCSFDGTTKFAVYARGGSVSALSCGLQSGVNAFAITEGAHLDIQDSSISDFTETAIIARDPGTSVNLNEVYISHGNRAISVSEGAEISATTLDLSSITDVAIFANAASVTLDEFIISDSPNIGVYVDGDGDIDLRNGQFRGQLDTAVSLRGSGLSILSDLTITSARVGISVSTSGREVEILGLRSSAELPTATHIISDAAELIVEDSVLLGGGTAIWASGNSHLSLQNSLIAGVGNAGILFEGSSADESRMSALWNRFWVSGDAVAIQAQNVRASVVGNLIHYDDVALSGSAFAHAQIENNGFVGPVASALWLGDRLSLAPRWSNRSADASSKALQALFSTPFQANPDDIAGDTAQLGSRFDDLQADLGLSPTDVSVHSIALVSEGIQPAVYAKVVSLYKLDDAGETEFVGSAYGSDLPLRVSPGSYRLDQGYGRVVDADLLGDETYELPFSPPPTPYALAASEGILTAGFALRLRPREEVQTLWQKRWPGYAGFAPWEGRGYPILRPNASQDDISKARAFALSQLEGPIAFLKSVGEGAVHADFPPEQAINHIASWNVLPTILDILLVVGTQDDARILAEALVEIADATPTQSLVSELARASVQISLRLGRLDGSPAAKVWKNLGSVAPSPAYAKLGIALGRAGYQPAVDAFIQTFAVDRTSFDIVRLDDGIAIFDLITQREHAAVLALAADMVEAFGTFAKAYLLDEPNEPYSSGLHVGAALNTALGYTAAYLPERERSKLAVGLPHWADVNGAWFENPELLVDHFFGISSGAYVGQNDNALIGLPCRFYGNLRGDVRDRVEQRYVQLLTQLADHYDNERPALFASIRSAVGKSRCIVNSEALGPLKNPQNNDVASFPLWMQFGLRDPSEFFPDFVENPEIYMPMKAVLASFDDAGIEEILSDALISDLPGVKAYKIYRSVADPSGIGNAGPYLGQNDTRFFLESVQSPAEGTLWLAAKVTLAPRMARGRTLFGINLDTAEGDLGGLAGMINRHGEKMAGLTGNFGRSLIDKVVLRHSDGAIDLAFLQTANNGTHIFELTKQPTSNSGLYLDIYFQGVDRGWTVTFPIFASPFGHQQIQASGEINLAG